jgi:hypothetical protein
VEVPSKRIPQSFTQGWRWRSAQTLATMSRDAESSLSWPGSLRCVASCLPTVTVTIFVFEGIIPPPLPLIWGRKALPPGEPVSSCLTPPTSSKAPCRYVDNRSSKIGLLMNNRGRTAEAEDRGGWIFDQSTDFGPASSYDYPACRPHRDRHRTTI